MIRNVTSLAAALIIAVTASGAEPKLADCPPPPPGFPKFKWQEIAADFKIGYAVHICDVNADGKPDIVVVDKDRVVWYENPTWKMRTILKGKTKPDNVCICSLDIDGDGKIDFVLGAGWKPFDTKTPGTLQWLRRGKTLDDEWEMFPIPCDEPMVHRIKVADVFHADSPQIIMAPLMGRDATKERNYMDGKPVRVMAYGAVGDPTKAENWKSASVSESLHVVHNFVTIPDPKYHGILYASYEGITASGFRGNGFELSLWHEGNQTTPNSNRGASEIAATRSIGSGITVATVEPWHGNQIVIYRPGENKEKFVMTRNMIDDHLRWGHAVQFGKLTDAKERFLIAGVRDNPDPKQGDKFTEKRGVRLYRATDDKGEKWDRYILEDGGVAVEDLAVADLNGDGKPDIIAVGRATQNCRIYWNQGK